MLSLDGSVNAAPTLDASAKRASRIGLEHGLRVRRDAGGHLHRSSSHHTRAHVDGVDAEVRRVGAGWWTDRDELLALVVAAKAGDRAAAERLIERFTARVRAVTRAHRLRAADAEDVVQTTWLRLLEHAEVIREPGAVGAWLETTARRECLRVLRRLRREHPTDNERLLDRPVDPVDEERLVAADDLAALERALARLPNALTRLPPAQRRMLSMLIAEPAPSYAEISRVLGVPIGSIGPTRARSLARLRRDPELAGAFAGGPE